MTISFEKPPTVKAIRDESGKAVNPAQAKISFVPRHERIVYLVTAEAYVTKLLDREEFRKLCDQHKTAQAILANLK